MDNGAHRFAQQCFQLIFEYGTDYQTPPGENSLPATLFSKELLFYKPAYRMPDKPMAFLDSGGIG